MDKSKRCSAISSTDRGEAWHKPLKASYRASNKGAQADEFILRHEERMTAFRLWEMELPEEDRFTGKKKQRSKVSCDWDTISDSEDEGGLEQVSGKSLDGVKLVAFTKKSRRWKGLREIGVVEDELDLDGLAEKTLVTLRHITAGRQKAVRLRREDSESRGRIEIRGYNGLKVTYPTVHDTNIMIEEQVWCKPDYAYGQDKTWKKSRFDTVLLRYSDPNGSDNQMENRRVARLLLLFSIPDP